MFSKHKMAALINAIKACRTIKESFIDNNVHFNLVVKHTEIDFHKFLALPVESPILNRRYDFHETVDYSR